MNQIISWLKAYPEYLQGLLFAVITIFLFLRDEKPIKQGKIFIVSFLLSFNSVNTLAVFLFLGGKEFFHLESLGIFFLATLSLMIPAIVLGSIYTRVLGKKIRHSFMSMHSFLSRIVWPRLSHLLLFSDALTEILKAMEDLLTELFEGSDIIRISADHFTGIIP